MALIGDPAAYDGRRVRVIGYLNLEFEGDALYLGKADFDAAITENALWVERPTWVNRRDFAGRYALLEGTFRADNHGHMGLFAGAIEHVDRLQPSPSRRDFGEMSRISWWQAYWRLVVGAALFSVGVSVTAYWLVRGHQQ